MKKLSDSRHFYRSFSTAMILMAGLIIGCSRQGGSSPEARARLVYFALPG